MDGAEVSVLSAKINSVSRVKYLFLLQKVGGAQLHMLLQVGLTMCGKLLISDN